MTHSRALATETRKALALIAGDIAAVFRTRAGQAALESWKQAYADEAKDAPEGVDRSEERVAKMVASLEKRTGPHCLRRAALCLAAVHDLVLDEAEPLFVPKARRLKPLWANVSFAVLRFARSKTPQEIAGTFMSNLAAVRAAVSDEGGQDGAQEESEPKPRVKRDVALPLILDHLKRRPHDTAKEVASAVGCSVGTVAESPAWRENQKRLKQAKLERRDPKAIKLDERACKGLNAAGLDPGRQKSEARRQEEAHDKEIDERERALHERIGEYQKGHPDATSQEVAKAVGCTAGEVERRAATLEQLAKEQTESARKDGGGRLAGESDAELDQKQLRKWVKEKP